MLRKYFSIIVFTAAAFGLGSCSSNVAEMEPDMPVQTKGVTLYVNMPEPLQTAAETRSTGPLNSNYGDGSRANGLHYAVYRSGTDEIVFSSEEPGEGDSWIVVPGGDKKNANYGTSGDNNDWQFKIDLPYVIEGQKYDMIFWCQYKGPKNNPTDFYKFDPKTREVTIKYADENGNTIVDGKDEGRDAFFNRVEGLDIDAHRNSYYITLRRPFAQLNIGSDDQVGASWSGINYEQCKVVVKNVYRKLNLWTGEASDPVDVTFDWVSELSGEKISYGIPGYRWLSMSYVLTGSQIIDGDVNQAQQETKDVHIFLRGNGGSWNHDFELSGIPFQRNYKTYIHGHLFTTTEEGIKLSILLSPAFYEPDNKVEF